MEVHVQMQVHGWMCVQIKKHSAGEKGEHWGATFQGRHRYVLRPGPDSPCSCLENHRFWNVVREVVRVVAHLYTALNHERTWWAYRGCNPPIQTEYFPLKQCYNLDLQSAMPGYMVVLPEGTTSPSLSRQISQVTLEMECSCVRGC